MMHSTTGDKAEENNHKVSYRFELLLKIVGEETTLSVEALRTVAVHTEVIVLTDGVTQLDTAEAEETRTVHKEVLNRVEHAGPSLCGEVEDCLLIIGLRG